jgi:hypothetical protein
MKKIDLRKDFKSVYKHVAERIRDYPIYINAGPGEDEDPISQITLGFQFDQAGWIALVFDTRPNAESDGHWQFYIEENAVYYDHWFDALDELHEATIDDEEGPPVQLTLLDGSKKVLTTYVVEVIAKDIGDMLWQVLVEARQAKRFAKLPLAEQCLMGVDEHDGYYGWPHYKDRFTLGRVQQDD